MTDPTSPYVPPASEAVWRVCETIKGDCENCPAEEDYGAHGRGTRGCYCLAEQCVNTVETGNPWRKTGKVRAPWVAMIAAAPEGEGGWTTSYEFAVYQEDDEVACGEGGDLSKIRAEAGRYAAVYGQDGPVQVTVQEIRRRVVPVSALNHGGN